MRLNVSSYIVCHAVAVIGVSGCGGQESKALVSVQPETDTWLPPQQYRPIKDDDSIPGSLNGAVLCSAHRQGQISRPDRKAPSTSGTGLYSSRTASVRLDPAHLRPGTRSQPFRLSNLNPGAIRVLPVAVVVSVVTD